MSDPDLKQVALRLQNLEKQVATIARRPRAAELSADDISAYHRVQNAFWEDGTCGINETSPCIMRCNVVVGGKVTPFPKACDCECTCGPCLMSAMATGGTWRFRGLGGV